MHADTGSERDRDHALVSWINDALTYLRQHPDTTEDQFAANWPAEVGKTVDQWWGRIRREAAFKTARDVYRIWQALH